MEKKISFCDQAKTLMMILVIAMHAMAFYWGNWFKVMTTFMFLHSYRATYFSF